MVCSSSITLSWSNILNLSIAVGDYAGDHSSTSYLAGGSYDPSPLTPTPFTLPTPPASYEPSIHSPHPPTSAGLAPSPTGYVSSSSGSGRKAVMSTSSSSQYNPRLIQHTDAEDEYPHNELIELPPSYSENRRPIAGLGVANPSISTPQQQTARGDVKGSSSSSWALSPPSNPFDPQPSERES